MKKLIFLFAVSAFILNCASDDSGDSNNCSMPDNLNVNNLTNTTASFSWYANVDSSLHQVEYGTFGFVQGIGTTITVPEPYTNIEDLEPLTQYAFYVRVFCNDAGEYSNWAGPFSFVTLENNPYCNDPRSFQVEFTLGDDSIGHNYIDFGWLDYSVDGSQIQYGLQGFNLGSGITMTDTDDSYQYQTISGLDPETTYDFYLRNICNDTGYSSWVGPVTETTKPTPFNLDCLDPVNFTLDEIYNSGGSDHLVFSWDARNGENTWQLHKVVSGNPFSSGATLDTNYNPIHLTNHTSAGVVYDFYIRANCGIDGYSDWLGPITVTGP